MKLLRWLLIFALTVPALAQNTRWDLPITTVQAQGGNLLPVYAIPGAGIVFYSCSGANCTTLATTYISATSATTCPTSPVPAQVVLNGTSACVSSADPYGNMGGWFQSGQYMATITAQGSSYNYLFTVNGGSGLPTGGLNGDVIINNGTSSVTWGTGSGSFSANGPNFFGDSLTTGIGAPVVSGQSPQNPGGYAYLLQRQVGSGGTNYAVSGSQAGDMVLQVIDNLGFTRSGNLPSIVLCCTNDANPGNPAYNAAGGVNVSAELTALAAYHIPKEEQITGANYTTPCVVNSGTITTSTIGIVTTIHFGAGGGQITCTTLPTGANATAVEVSNIATYNGTQTATAMVDGGAGTTLYSGAISTGSIATQNNATISTLFGTIIGGLTAAATHSVVISSTGAFDISEIAQEIGVTPTALGNQSVNPPILFMGGTIRQKADANSAQTLAMDGVVSTACGNAATLLGIPCIFVPVRDFVNATTDMGSGTLANGCTVPNSSLAGLHPNYGTCTLDGVTFDVGGHPHLRDAFLQSMQQALRPGIEGSNIVTCASSTYTLQQNDGVVLLSSCPITIPQASTFTVGNSKEYTLINYSTTTTTTITCATNCKNVPDRLLPLQSVTLKHMFGSTVPLNYGSWYAVKSNSIAPMNDNTRYYTGTTDTLQISDGLIVLNNASGGTETIGTPTSLGLSNADGQAYVIFAQQGTWTLAGATILGAPGTITPNAAITISPISATQYAMTNYTATAGTGTVTSFAAPSGSWPTWLVPTVTNSTTAPSLAVASSLTLANVAAGVAPAGVFDFSGATLVAPVGSSYTSGGTNGRFGYNTNNPNWHFALNGGDSFLALFSASSPPTSGHCAEFLLTSTVWTLADAGAACGSGGSMTWPGTAGYALYSGSSSWSTPHLFDNATTISATEPITTTGSLSSGATPPTCTGNSIICLGEQATANTSASAVDTVQAISGTHQFEVSLNAGSPFVSAMNYAIGTSGGTVPLLNGTNTWSGVNTFSSAPILSSLTGYLYGNGATAVTASTTIPYSALTGAPTVNNAAQGAISWYSAAGTVNTLSGATITGFVYSAGSTSAPLAATATNLGTLANLPQYSIPYSAGTSSALTDVPSPTANGVYADGWNITASAAAAPVSFQITGSGVSCTGSPLVCTFSGGTGSGTVTAAAQYDVPYYTQSGTTAQVGGAAIAGFQFDSTSGAPAAATATNLGTLANLAANSILYSGGTSSAITSLAASATASFPMLSGASAAPTWATIQYPASCTSGGVIYGSSATALACSSTVTAHGLLVSGGAGTAPSALAVGGANFPLVGVAASNPAFSTIGWLASATQWGIPYMSTATQMSTTAALTSNQPIIGSSSSAPTQGFALGSGTGTANKLACVTSSNTQANCTALPPNNVLGVFNTTSTYITTGIVSVTIDATQNVTFGDIICNSSVTAAEGHDNGVNACSPGQMIGIVTTTASSVSAATTSLRFQ